MLSPEEAVAALTARFESAKGKHHWAAPYVVQDLGPDELFPSGGAEAKAVVLAALDEYARLDAEFKVMLGPKHDTNQIFKEPYKSKRIQRDAMEVVVQQLIRRKLPWTDEELLDLLGRERSFGSTTPLDVALQQIKKLVKPKGAKLGEAVLERLMAMAGDPAWSSQVTGDRVIRELIESRGGAASIVRTTEGLELHEAEEWARVLVLHVNALPADEQQALLGCLYCARDATSAKPSAAWRKSALKALEAAGSQGVRDALLEAFHAVPLGRLDVEPDAEHRYRISDSGADFLRGSTWLLSLDPWPGLGAELADLLVTSLKKLKWQGPRCVKLANACIWSLGEMATHGDEAVRMSALAQMAKLKARVSFKTTLKAIQKALIQAAEASGVSVEELEELGVPAFGFEGGRLERAVGGATAVLELDRSRVLVHWTNDKGKSVKSPPASVKRDHSDEVKELKRIVKDAEAIAAGTRARLDGLYVRNASWTHREWRERYLDHGLVGSFARRLIWTSDGVTFLPTDDGFEDAQGAPLTLSEDARIALWHPITSPTEEVLAWRERVESLELVQPFKQTHREVYVLTDAERQTGVYSNRFAAHIVKQHQFAALAKGRGWSHALRLMVDDFYVQPQRSLAAHGLRAEFWVEPVGDEYGTDTTETGTYLHLATDQVRFYREGAPSITFHATGGAWSHDDQPEDEPLPLDTIDAVVFSEVMRDADLFVGVTSVSNDPNWTDGGREPAQMNYWHNASFGELNATAETRKDILGRLVPRLKIASQCTLEGRFLKVVGSRRTYKIHLGSGNIMMEPDDQYLCIVPDSRATKAAASKVFLPFEGDRTLSIILSKAFLLAADDKIKDGTILSQIGRA